MIGSLFSRLALVAVLVLSPLAARASVDCEALAAQAAAQAGIPEGLLPAIARIESGRKQGKVVRAWPWALNQAGKGMYFDTRQQALAYLQQAVASGVRNIDVGCMQINYRWHGDQFGSLEDMFDPVANTRYAARFLDQLYRQHGDWDVATRYYHSSDPERGAWYQGKVASVRERVMLDAEASQMATASQVVVMAPPAQPVVSSKSLLTGGTPLIALGGSAAPGATAQPDYASLIPGVAPFELSKFQSAHVPSVPFWHR